MTSAPYFTLTEEENASLNGFMLRSSVRRLMKNGGQLALVFSYSSGIGTNITATVKDKDGKIESTDLTDYKSW